MNGIAQVVARVATIQSQFATASASPPPATGPFSAAFAEKSPLAGTGAAGEWADALPDAGRVWADEITEVAQAEGVDPRLLAALVWQESGFRADARSSAGASGLAQLMPATARSLGVDATDPVDNLRGGARYLREQLDRFGSAELALAAYNAGPGRVAQAGGVPQIRETQNYVRRVMDHYAALGGTR